MTSEMRWEAPVDTGRPGLRFLVDHRVDGTPVMPAAAFVEIALSARPGHDLLDLRIPAPLPVPAEPGRRLHTILDGEIGRAHVCTPVTNAQLVCRLLPVNKKIPTK